MDCMQLQDRKEKNFYSTTKCQQWIIAMYYPQEIIYTAQELEFKAPSSKQTSEIITQHSTANLEIEPTISIEENTTSTTSATNNTEVGEISTPDLHFSRSSIDTANQEQHRKLYIQPRVQSTKFKADK